MLPALFAKLSATINPFVVSSLSLSIKLKKKNSPSSSLYLYFNQYSLNHPKIRKEMGRRLNCCRRRHSAFTSHSYSSSGNTTSRSRTRQSQRRDSPILHFTSRLSSHQKKTDESSYDLKEIQNYLHQSSQLFDQLHHGLVNGPSRSSEPRDLHYNHSSSNSKPKTAGTRSSQSETICCADVHHIPSQTHPYNVAFQ